MDAILRELQGRAFHLSDAVYDFLSGKYEKLVGLPIPELQAEGFHPGFFGHVIGKHRGQFRTREYIQSRIDNPTTGTLDHMHCEITASIAVRLGLQARYTGYALELLRFTAHMHDSDRSYPSIMIRGEQEVRHDRAAYILHKEKHVRNSSEIALRLSEDSRSEGFSFHDGFPADAEYLILRHEKGGRPGGGHSVKNTSAVDTSLDLDRLTDILTDADSLAYFDANILTNWEESNRSTTALSNKVHFMYDRMSDRGRIEFQTSILNSPDHILGENTNHEEDILSIRTILSAICV